MRTGWWVLAALAVAGCTTTTEKAMLKDAFISTTTGLRFATDGWSVRTDDGRGVVSLKVGGAEFLHATDAAGGMSFRRGKTLVTRFTDHNNISHDRTVGRVGSVSDGLYLLKFIPDHDRAAFSLYAGFNVKRSHQLVMFLSDDVPFVRMGKLGGERTWMRRIVTQDTKSPVKSDGAVIVHKSGRALLVDATCAAGVIPGPGGKPRLAVWFDCKGFAANSFTFVVDPAPRAENFVLTPQFNVKSSDDPKTKTLGATAGALNPVYGPDTKLDFRIEFTWLGKRPFSGHAELEVVHALGKRHCHQRKVVRAATAGKVSVKFDPTFTMPGVSEVWGRLVSKDGRLIWTNRYRMLYDYENYRPRLNTPPDFKAFWDKTLAELRKTPLAPKTVRVAKFKDHPVLEIHEVTFNSWGGGRIYAMLYVPKKRTGPLPAIVSSHPGTTGYGISRRPDGTYGSKVRQDLRFVTIVPLIRGHKPDAKDIPFNHPWWGPLHGRDTYAARSWYCAMVRAVDYLATRPGLVDMKRIVARGGSQGGALALVTAALDPRVTVCIADCPANCMPHEIMESYGSFGPSRGQVPAGKTLDDVKRLLSYYDPVNFCPLIRCPAYVGSNVGDLTVHSMGPLAAYRNLTALSPGRKAFYPGFTHFHGSGPGLGRKAREVLDRLSREN